MCRSLIIKFIALSVLFASSHCVYAEDNRPFWTEKSSWVEGGVLFSVGVASNVVTEENGRDLAYKNGISEIEKYIHVTDLGSVPIETQMTYTEKLKDGRLNVYRLLKADSHKLLELKKSQLERGEIRGQNLSRNEQDLKNIKFQLEEAQKKLKELTNKQSIMEKDAEIIRLKQKEADLERIQMEITNLKNQEKQVKASDEVVVFNIKTKVFHCSNCKWAVKCTKHCIKIPLSEAIKMGGMPCRTCGGKCLSR